jgi:hypothetical protein
MGPTHGRAWDPNTPVWETPNARLGDRYRFKGAAEWLKRGVCGWAGSWLLMSTKLLKKKDRFNLALTNLKNKPFFH